MSKDNCEVKVHSALGKYYIGDPCYVIPDALWQKAVDKMFGDGDHQTEFKITLSAIEVANVPLDPVIAKNFQKYDRLSFGIAGTRYGDGEYNGYGVDSGSLGVVPWELVDPENYEAAGDLGKVFEVDGDIEMIVEDSDFWFYANGKQLESIQTSDPIDESDEIIDDSYDDYEDEDDYEDDYDEDEDADE